MKVLVTGGAGFIGSHLCEKLLKKKYNVICLDNLYAGSKKNINHLLKNKDFKFIKGDIRSEKIINKLTKEVDAIYHLAAIVGVSEVVRSPIENISVNVEGTINIAKFAHKNGQKKVIFTSSSEVYGKNTEAPLKEESSSSVFGSTKVNRWAYGLAKALGEHALLGYAEKGLPISIIRYFNCYGPRGVNKRYSNVVPKFIRQVLEGKNLTIHGKGNQTRCFCYVDDTVRGTILAGESERSLSEVFNIGSNKEISIKDLAKEINDLTNSKSDLIFLDEEKVFKKNYESSRRRVPDIEKANRILNFKPKFSLSRGLKETIKWMKSYSR